MPVYMLAKKLKLHENSRKEKKPKTEHQQEPFERTANESNVILNQAEKKQADEINCKCQVVFFPYKPTKLIHATLIMQVTLPPRGLSKGRDQFWDRIMQGVGSRELRPLNELNA